MARVTVDSIQKKITAVDEKIAAAKGNIKKYEEQKVELIRQLDEFKLNEIKDLMDMSGITVDDLKKMIKEATKE